MPPPQTPLMHGRPQQLAPGKLQLAPGGKHGPHGTPQTAPTWFTQTLSQVVWQQKGSAAQILLMHGSHFGDRAEPTTHSLCEQATTPPQMPPLHCMLQHCAGVAQGDPSPRQAKGPHCPSGLQGPAQQGGPFGEHSAPSGWHIGGPQIPFEQRLLQHGVVGEQSTPSGLHFGAPQMPFGPQVPLQQSVDTLQGNPSGSHIGFCWHRPLPQMLVQHCEGAEHGVPFAPQAPPHTPALHTPSQHSAAATQLVPAGLQTGEPPVPPVPIPPVPMGRPSPRLLRPQLASRKGTQSHATTATSNQA
jgi:hypothetical protein